MKAQLGKPTGLALALLATLLATFLAMGVFSVAQANTHNATRTISPTTVAPGGEITVNIALSAYGAGGSVSETLPEGFDIVSGSVSVTGGDAFPRPSGNKVNVIIGKRRDNGSYLQGNSALFSRRSIRFHWYFREL